MTKQMPSASGPEAADNTDPHGHRKLPPRSQLLHEAASIIDIDRNHTYGTPTQNFKNIAELWTVRLRHKLKDGEAFAATDVADFMVLLKIARNIAQRQRDNYMDLAGYAGCGYEAMLEEDEQKLRKTLDELNAASPTQKVRDHSQFASGGIIESPDRELHITVNVPKDIDQAEISEMVARTIAAHSRKNRAQA